MATREHPIHVATVNGVDIHDIGLSDSRVVAAQQCGCGATTGRILGRLDPASECDVCGREQLWPEPPDRKEG